MRVCLVFEYSLTYYSRILLEIEALQQAGAVVHLLTSHSAAEDPPAGVIRTVVPLETARRFSGLIPAPRAGSTPMRSAYRVLRSAARHVVDHVEPADRPRVTALREIAAQVDLFWVIDFPSLPTVITAVKGTNAKVVYETVDLVPEYQYGGDRHRRRTLDRERRLLGNVDGLITACDSYADYYMERYGTILKRRPFVRNNMPESTVSRPGATSRPLRLLFLGSLLFDRPGAELVEAVALAESDVTLTFQGRDLVGGAVSRSVEALGLHDRVEILEPCLPGMVVETARAYDIGIVALRGENENERRASTSKLFTYMSAGLAILGSDLPGIARVVSEHRNGLLVKRPEPSAWAKGIDAIASLSDNAIDTMRLRSVDAAQKYAWQTEKHPFVAEFVRALHGPRFGESTLLVG